MQPAPHVRERQGPEHVGAVVVEVDDVDDVEVDDVEDVEVDDVDDVDVVVVVVVVPVTQVPVPPGVELTQTQLEKALQAFGFVPATHGVPLQTVPPVQKPAVPGELPAVERQVQFVPAGLHGFDAPAAGIAQGRPSQICGRAVVLDVVGCRVVVVVCGGVVVGLLHSPR